MLSCALLLVNCVADIFAGTGCGSSVPIVDSSCWCRVVVHLDHSPWCVVVIGASSNIGNMVMVVVMLVATGTIRSRGP